MVRCLIVALAAVVAGVAVPGAQQATFHGGTHTVSVYATVVDRTGRLVPDLTKDDFEILDDGKPQPLSVFRNDIQPITIVIMLDRSGSMLGNFTIVRDAAEQFVTNLLPADKAKLGSFSNSVRIDPQDFTSDPNELIRILRNNLQSAGPTPLWNATFAAMNALGQQEGRRVVLLFTDGYDSPGRPDREYHAHSGDRSLADRRDHGVRDRSGGFMRRACTRSCASSAEPARGFSIVGLVAAAAGLAVAPRSALAAGCPGRWAAPPLAAGRFPCPLRTCPAADSAVRAGAARRPRPSGDTAMPAAPARNRTRDCRALRMKAAEDTSNCTAPTI